ncbi:MAG: hypothetical protein ACR2N7_05805 [Acidimicrobiia bacterium]
MTEFSVRLANTPGQLARVARLLADADVAIEAFATFADNGYSQVRFVVTAAPRARRALMAADLEFDERDVLDTFLPRGAGALAHMAEELAHAGVNIDSMYLLHSNAEGFHLAVTVDDADVAYTALAG